MSKLRCSVSSWSCGQCYVWGYLGSSGRTLQAVANALCDTATRDCVFFCFLFSCGSNMLCLCLIVFDREFCFRFWQFPSRSCPAPACHRIKRRCKIVSNRCVKRFIQHQLSRFTALQFRHSFGLGSEKFLRFSLQKLWDYGDRLVSRGPSSVDLCQRAYWMMSDHVLDCVLAHFLLA